MSIENITKRILDSVLKNLPETTDKVEAEKLIRDELSFIQSINGIKILNSARGFDDGVFVYHRNGFVIVNVKNGIAKTKNITDDAFIDIMTESYICKFLSMETKDYSKEIRKHNKNIIKYL